MKSLDASALPEHGSLRYFTAVCFAAALGGLLFGFDTAVISGAIGFLQKQFHLGELMLGWVGSSTLVGCVVGSAIAGWLADRFDGLENDPETHALVAATTTAEQVMDLVKSGVNEFHFYTNNRADLVFGICHLLGVRPTREKATA